MNPECERNIHTGRFVSATLDMYPCLDIFVLGSLPHFYLTDPNILTTMDGMKPTKDLHKTGVNFDLVRFIFNDSMSTTKLR